MNWLAVILVTLGIVLNNRNNPLFWLFLLLADIMWIIYSYPRGDYSMIVFCLIVMADNIWDNYIRNKNSNAYWNSLKKE